MSMEYSGAVFTARLKDVYQMTGGEWDSSSGISVLTGGDIGLDNYPLFSDGKPRTGDDAILDYRPTLNGKIFDHFMNREIGYESVGLFQLAMRRKMNEIMPVINQMYLSQLLTIVPISTVNLSTNNSATDSLTGETTVSTTSASNANSSARSVSSQMPQTMLSPDEDYADSASDTNSANTTTGTGSNTNNETRSNVASGDTATTGYQGSPSDLLMRYRQTFINPDMMVINELEELFMQIWDNGDTFTNHYEGSGYIDY